MYYITLHLYELQLGMIRWQLINNNYNNNNKIIKSTIPNDAIIILSLILSVIKLFFNSTMIYNNYMLVIIKISTSYIDIG